MTARRLPGPRHARAAAASRAARRDDHVQRAWDQYRAASDQDPRARAAEFLDRLGLTAPVARASSWQAPGVAWALIRALSARDADPALAAAVIDRASACDPSADPALAAAVTDRASACDPSAGTSEWLRLAASMPLACHDSGRRPGTASPPILLDVTPPAVRFRAAAAGCPAPVTAIDASSCSSGVTVRAIATTARRRRPAACPAYRRAAAHSRRATGEPRDARNARTLQRRTRTRSPKHSARPRASGATARASMRPWTRS